MLFSEYNKFYVNVSTLFITIILFTVSTQAIPPVIKSPNYIKETVFETRAGENPYNLDVFYGLAFIRSVGSNCSQVKTPRTNSIAVDNNGRMFIHRRKAKQISVFAVLRQRSVFQPAYKRFRNGHSCTDSDTP